MKIVVYFENGMASEVVAQFASEELYDACFPAIDKKAKEDGYVVTESMREDEEVTDNFDYDGDEAQAIDDASWRA